MERSVSVQPRSRSRRSRPGAQRSSPITERVEAVIFNSGVSGPQPSETASIRSRVEQLCAAGVDVFVVAAPDIDTVDGKLAARPRGPGRLFLCVNRGSQVFEVTGTHPELKWSRRASAAEHEMLDRAAELAVAALCQAGLVVEVVAGEVDRRSLDLLPGVPYTTDTLRLLRAVDERLRQAGVGSLGDVVSLAADAARQAGLTYARIRTDVSHVELGLTDEADAGRWAAGWLADRGVTGRLILVVGSEFGGIRGVAGRDAVLLIPELDRAEFVSVGAETGGMPPRVVHLGGGWETLCRLLDAQLACRRERRVPRIDPDPGWVVPLPDVRPHTRASEALGTLSNGLCGTRAAREDDGALAAPPFLVSGVYTRDDDVTLMPGPGWTRLDVLAHHHSTPRALDLRTGVLEGSSTDRSPLRTLRLVSIAMPHALALRAEGPSSLLAGPGPLFDPGGTTDFERTHRGDVQLARTSEPSGPGIVVAARDWQGTAKGHRVVERMAAWTATSEDHPGWDETLERLSACESTGFDRLLAEHRAAWAERWRDAEVTIEGSPDDQLAARFALFHLLSVAPDEGDAAVGARGLTGPAYGGHVFWDADVFVLPALAAVRPAAARAMLEYRLRRLPAARAAAAADGRRGARFPWESADEGWDVTPTHVHGRRGELIPVRTGLHEVHVVGDVAWAADHYATWTGDAAFLAGPGRDLLTETARYWASRARHDSDGRAHLYGVMGPDEYHAVVDDNTFTNLLARWNLRRAAAIVEQTGGALTEASAWRELADAIVDGYQPASGLYEQFAGYWALEPLIVTQFAEPPVAADVVLGTERLAGSQVIKQADVLMAHHLLPEDVVAGSLDPNLAFYEPRTAHGSIAPSLPAAWSGLRLGMRFHGQPITVRAGTDRVTVTCSRRLMVRVGDAEAQPCNPPSQTFTLERSRQ